ncbi:MAG: hypothetical protein V9H26_24465 [Verrucomicrobiota bacterium]|nr:hypothetical protein [Verrucomicrobiota bacterium]MCC6823241.1 hypothetical protein [Limisphaerales bacterium]
MPTANLNLPSQPVTLAVSQIEQLNQQLSNLRHDINNHLSLMLAAAEVMRRKPEAAERMSATFEDQPRKVTAAMLKFSAEFEKSLAIKKS